MNDDMRTDHQPFVKRHLVLPKMTLSVQGPVRLVNVFRPIYVCAMEVKERHRVGRATNRYKVAMGDHAEPFV
ncbi:hypothetical protein NQ318_013653 [Aromia moschata]|uniref:Uncharacterized protein n=1 Tax=Aromia moschata TaxID=1265417 RepID=A0AAV8Y277_9CUCU|nr:hypothetical protein NQ318_013653 [Aromia moschata]